ncbi:MAG: GAF and ANTAR domain-containing protein [Kineosporiaceae bacterium]|nr:GAF and ANTAR domain-containing protein [Aeromicrobium sp.]
MRREQLIAKTFVELTDTLVDEFDVLDVMHTLTDCTIELLGADAAGLILSDQRGNMQVVASTSHEARLVELFALQNDEGPCLDCFNSGKTVVNVGPDEAVDRWPRFTAAATAAGYRSTHALPLRLRRQCIGAIALFCKDESTLSEDDLALGQALADVATISLLQERAVRQNELLAEQLQTALNRRVLIEQAKGSLAARTDVATEATFGLIRDYCRRTQQPLSLVATAIIDGSLDATRLQVSELPK